MEYSELTFTARYYFPVITAVFFLIKLFGGTSQDRKHSAVISALCIIYFIMPSIGGEQGSESYLSVYVSALGVTILLLGAAMLSMFALAAFDKKAFIHAVIFAFMILFNFMLAWHYVMSPSQFFYLYFDELIILISLVQILVSSNGIIDSISNVYRFFRSAQSNTIRVFASCLRWMGNLQKNKRSEIGT